MNIILNQKEYTTDDHISIEHLLAQLEYKLNGIAVAVNQSVIPRDMWTTHLLNETDDVLIIQATQGG